jgi:tripartite-type tricarboxylate transporter receptor subunit TctC
MAAFLRLFCIALFTATTLALPAHAADPFPGKPIKFLVPATPGGSADAVTRALADVMTKELGTTVVVENRPGAGGVVATEVIVKAPADGYAIELTNSSHMTNPLFLKEVPYDTLRDTMALSYVGYIPLVLVTPPDSPYRSLKDVIAAAKAKPGAVQFASGGVGSGGHLAGELLKYQAGVDMTHVPFQGNAPAVTSVLGGHVPLMFDTIANSLPNITAGKLRALALSAPKRSVLLPDVPTVAESGFPNFDVSASIIVIARAGTPSEAVAKLNAAMNKAINDPELRARPSMRGIEWVGGTPADADAYVKREMELWAKVVKETGIGKN